jgi:site-specific recombinase
MNHRSDTDLTAALTDLIDAIAQASTATIGACLARLVATLRPSSPNDVDETNRRLQLLLSLLRADATRASALGSTLNAALCARVHRMLYADSGRTGSRGFFGELSGRLLGRLLPPPIQAEFLTDLINEVFEETTDHEWLAAIPLSTWRELLDTLAPDRATYDRTVRHCRQEMAAATLLVSHRIAALGTDPTLVRYLAQLARHESPFMAQTTEVRRLVEEQFLHGDQARPDDRHLDVLLVQCDTYLATVRRRSREAGVSVGLVFQLAQIEHSLIRLRLLQGLLRDTLTPPPAGARERVIEFFLMLVRQENRRHSVSDLLSSTFELLARRATEHASRSGEHYVTETRRGLVRMYRAAAGAGLIIGVMALIKIGLGKLALPPLWEAIAYSLNYGLGFVLIHILHLTIATKQPAMTAATLAAALDGATSRERREEVVADISARVSRTQWVSIAGNVSVGFITALAIGLTTSRFLGWNMVDLDKGEHLLHDLHPWRSLALFHAAIAGVFLFLSGLVSGYFDNLALYHHVPERLRRVRALRTLFGDGGITRLCTYVEHNLGALTGNFLFGCMLGMTPLLGKLTGLPLDIRHVAFASANLAYGLVATHFHAGQGVILVSVLGVFLVGAVNLAVSFTLALNTALRSRGITAEQTAGLGVAVLRRFAKQPLTFFWAPAGTASTAPDSTH